MRDVPPPVLADLERHLDQYARPGSDGLVLIGPKGGPIRRSHVHQAVWQPARAAARLPQRATFHDLRALSATAAARQGATVEELMHRLGHSSVVAAMNYQRAGAGGDRTLAEAMSAAAMGQGTTRG